MNYLAHILLSGTDTDIQIGNFMGDAIKGKDYLNYPDNIRKGILLHRQIDSFTDFNPIVHQSKKRLHPRYGHYAGVLIDIFYDYFLSENWQHFSDTPLTAFITDFYTVVQQKQALLPNRTKKIVPFMIEQNWLYKYGNIEGLTRVLIGMEKRIKHDIPLHLGIEDIQEQHDALNADFMQFFPLLVAYSKEVLSKLE